MTILDRNKVPTSYYPTPSSEGSSIALSEAKRGDPSSNYFQYPDYLLPLDASKLVQWLQECHYRAKLDFIGLPQRHLRHASKLVKSYGHDDLVRAVMLASHISKYPFTLKFVERLLNEES